MDKCFQSGVCCKLFHININKEEYESGRYQTKFAEHGPFTFEDAESIGANILEQHEDGSCIYLKDKKCSIHASRPKVCTAFFCNSKDPKFSGMIKKVEAYKRI